MKTFTNTTRKNIFVFIVGPLALIPAIVLGFLTYGAFSGLGLEMVGETIKFAIFVASVGLILFGYPLTLIIGIPSILILEYKNNLKLSYLLAIGLFSSVAISLIFYPNDKLFGSAWMFGYSGLSVSFGVWCANSWYKSKLIQINQSELGQ